MHTCLTAGPPPPRRPGLRRAGSAACMYVIAYALFRAVCAASYYKKGNKCVKCPKGFIKNIPGNGHCVKPPRKFAPIHLMSKSNVAFDCPSAHAAS